MQLWVVVGTFLIVNAEAARFFRFRLRDPKCRRLRCGKNCEMQVTSDECPKCICTPKCPELTCPKDCKINQKGEDLCPACECELETQEKEETTLDSIEQTPIQCPPPKCPFDCEIEREYDGPCPGCKCEDNVDLDLIQPETPCPPLECPPGCELEKEIDGQCSQCKCQKEEDTSDLIKPETPCPPLECPPGCELEKEFDGQCSRCKCQKEEDAPSLIKPETTCPPLECPPGCELEKEFDGQCSRCKCQKEEDTPIPNSKETCAPIRCRRGCRQDIGATGCPVCLCRMAPKCDSGCRLQRLPGDRHPKCYCIELKSDTALQEKLDKENNACEPLVSGCRGPDCLLKLDKKGCGVCDCTMPCKMPKCGFGCMRVRTGRCPICVCSFLSEFIV